MVVAPLDSPCHKQSDGHHVGGGFDRMGEGDSKKMQKLVLNRAKTNQTRDWPYLSQFLDSCHGCGCIGFSLPQAK